MPESLALTRQYHQALTERIRDYLRRQRGIADAVIDLHLLGWNGSRITIPVFDRTAQFAFFKLAKGRDNKSDSRKMLAPAGAHAELYGWERVLANPEQVVVREGEFDRLVLESHRAVSLQEAFDLAQRPQYFAQLTDKLSPRDSAKEAKQEVVVLQERGVVEQAFTERRERHGPVRALWDQFLSYPVEVVVIDECLR